MRLAYLTSRFPYADLGETFLRPEVRLLANLCEELHVIPARPALACSPFGDLGAIEPRIMPDAPRTLAGALAEAAAHPLRAAAALRLVLAPRYSTSAKIKNLLLFPKALAVARYMRKHRIDRIHANWLTTSSTVAYVAHVMTGIPWSCTAHAHDIFSDNLTAQKSASAQFVRVISARNARSLNALLGAARPRTYVGHLGVDVPPHAAPVMERPARAFAMVCPARLHPMKGHLDLLAALAILRDAGYAFTCDLAGDGEIRETVRERVAQLGLQSNVTLRGVVGHADLLAELRAGRYDAVVLASVEDPHERRFFEGIPVALIEAMAAGIPCVATRIGSIAELIDDRSGILVEQHDPNAFAAAIGRLADDPALRRTLGMRARERILTAFNAPKTARELYDSIAAGEPVTASGFFSGAAPSKPASMPAANAN